MFHVKHKHNNKNSKQINYMKRNISLVVTLICIFSFNAIQAQQSKPIVNDYLKGKYKFECLEELVNQGEFLRKCELCTFVFDVATQTTSIKSAEVNFLSDSLVINVGEKVTTVKYNGSRETNTFSFFYDKKYYNFKVFAYKDLFILEEDNGLLSVLTKLN